ncbi:MAG TPA: hypothetical protein PK036_09295, partial [Geobacteraceae bacterium]|nr:hypothetical protein [Geobacteraceae bacterium]
NAGNIGDFAGNGPHETSMGVRGSDQVLVPFSHSSRHQALLCHRQNMDARLNMGGQQRIHGVIPERFLAPALYLILPLIV